MSSVGLQTSDLNDGDIINATRMVPVEGTALEKLEVTLPSGKVLESNAYPPENRRKAILGWLEAVKQAVVEDLEETAAIARRAAMPPLDDTVLGVPKATLEKIAHDAEAHRERVEHATGLVHIPPVAPVSPAAFIEAQLTAARNAVESAVLAFEQALETKKAAEAALEGWLTLSEALPSTSLAPPAPGATAPGTSLLDVAASAGKGRRRQGRARQQKPSAPPAAPPGSDTAG